MPVRGYADNELVVGVSVFFVKKTSLLVGEMDGDPSVS